MHYDKESLRAAAAEVLKTVEGKALSPKERLAIPGQEPSPANFSIYFPPVKE